MTAEQTPKTDIAPSDALESGKDEAGLIFNGRGRARVQSALGGAKTICDILFQGEIENDLDGGFTIKSGTRLGLLQAMAACHEIFFESLQGRSSFDDVEYVSCDSQAYKHMIELRKFASTEKEQRRAALMARLDKEAA